MSKHTRQAALRRAARKAHAAQAKVSHALRKHALGAPPTTNAAARQAPRSYPRLRPSATRDEWTLRRSPRSRDSQPDARPCSRPCRTSRWTSGPRPSWAVTPSDAYDSALRGAHGSDPRPHIRAAGRLLWQSAARGVSWRASRSRAATRSCSPASVRLEICHCGRPNAGSRTLENLRRRVPQLEPPPLVDVPDEG